MYTRVECVGCGYEYTVVGDPRDNMLYAFCPHCGCPFYVIVEGGS